MSSTAVVGGRIRDGPIEILHLRITLLCKKHVDRLAAIERKENFRLTHRQVHVWKVRRPLNPHNLSRNQNLSRSWRNQFGTVFLLSGCANAVLGDCGAKATVNASSARINRGVFIFSVHPSERQLSIAVCAARTLLIVSFFVAPVSAKVFAFKIRLDIRSEIVEESRRLRVLFNPLLLAASIRTHI